MNQDSANGVVPLIRLFIDLALFRRGPEQAPASPLVLGALLLAYVGVGLAIAGTLPVPGGAGPWPTLFATAFALGWCWFMLRLARKPERFVQTAIALFGVQVLFTPFVGALQGQLLKAMGTGDMPVLLALLLLVVAIYIIAVVARILRIATEWPMPVCVLALLGQSMLEGLLALALFAPAVTSTPGAT